MMFLQPAFSCFRDAASWPARGAGSGVDAAVLPAGVGPAQRLGRASGQAGSYRLALALSACVALGAQTAAQAATPDDTPAKTPPESPSRSAAALPLPGGAQPASAPASYRYFIDSRGLAVMVEDRGQLRSVARLDLEGNPSQLLREESRIFVVCSGRGVAVIDVTQPTQPTLSGYLVAGATVARIEVRESSLWVWLAGGIGLVHELSLAGMPRLLRAEGSQAPLLTSISLLPPPRPKRTPGRDLMIVGGAVFGGLYGMPLLFAGFEPTLAIPFAGLLVASRGAREVVPLGILVGAGQITGLALFIAGVYKADAASKAGGAQAALRVLPYASHDSVGLVGFGRF